MENTRLFRVIESWKLMNFESILICNVFGIKGIFKTMKFE